MRLLVRHWSEEPVAAQGAAIVAENVLGKETRSRAFDTYRRVFRPRLSSSVFTVAIAGEKGAKQNSRPSAWPSYADRSSVPLFPRPVT